MNGLEELMLCSFAHLACLGVDGLARCCLAASACRGSRPVALVMIVAGTLCEVKVGLIFFWLGHRVNPTFATISRSTKTYQYFCLRSTGRDDFTSYRVTRASGRVYREAFLLFDDQPLEVALYQCTSDRRSTSLALDVTSDGLRPAWLWRSLPICHSVLLAWTTRPGFTRNTSAMLRGHSSLGCYIPMPPTDFPCDRCVC